MYAQWGKRSRTAVEHGAGSELGQHGEHLPQRYPTLQQSQLLHLAGVSGDVRQQLQQHGREQTAAVEPSL